MNSTQTMLTQVDAVMLKAINEISEIIRDIYAIVPAEDHHKLMLDFQRLAVNTGIPTCTVPNWGELEERFLMVQIKSGKASDLPTAL